MHEFGIRAPGFRQELGMRAGLEDGSSVHNGDAVCVADSGEPVRNDEARAPHLR